MGKEGLAIGIDLGTSGCRAVAIDGDASIIAQANRAMPAPARNGPAVEQDPILWWEAVLAVLDEIFGQIDARTASHLAIDGTSGSVLLTDSQGEPLSPGLMYNDARAVDEAQAISEIAPGDCAAHGPSSGLAKLLWLKKRSEDKPVIHVCTQADWVGGKLMGRFGFSDTNNVLKLGYDAVHNRWPNWLGGLGFPRQWLPEVYPSGTVLGPIHTAFCQRWGLSPKTQLVAGTTDSTAAIVATGAHEVGEAVTSLGSTLVMKVVTEQPIFAPEYGVYSQPYGDRWLVGGGSNTGGAVLRHYFSDAQLNELSEQIDSETPTGLDYYPLLHPGERFPFNDPKLPPRLEPRPKDDVLFLQGLFEGMAKIEAESYRRLEQLGAPYPRRVLSLGGGATNTVWQQIRARELGVEIYTPDITEAAYGSALLALRAK